MTSGDEHSGAVREVRREEEEARMSSGLLDSSGGGVEGADEMLRLWCRLFRRLCSADADRSCSSSMVARFSMDIFLLWGPWGVSPPLPGIGGVW